MNKKDFKTLIIFVILIVLILIVIIFNIYKNRSLNVDRKVKYIFDNYTYDNIIKEANALFLNAIKLAKNEFEYVKNNRGATEYYALEKYDDYKKIQNVNLILNSLSNQEISDYLSNHQILKSNNHYYIRDNNNINNSNYIGSKLELLDYDENQVFFKSTNYYCENHAYVGLIEDTIDCDYQSNESNFTIIRENNFLKIKDFGNIEQIIK